ncbi:hypothetical protein PN36_11375 [Candidatus Thiomargarita nelsonii]|uniref:Antitoxin VbhA domain-containing protein n=1 Tax=Candidatus Thiomargarita nelsonii TaxID=1003181 RepID=A0A0A6PKB8_9GAMM|nr:hypothetical protein PN36_11375 [Candidatus Thiomargarita nelsonii]
MTKRQQKRNPELARRDIDTYKKDLIFEMTSQAYTDGASHEEVGELQEQIKNGTYRSGDWERKVASWYD